MAKPIFTFRSISTTIGAALLAAFEIPGGVTTPEEFGAAVAEATAGEKNPFVPAEGKGLVVDGRGPVWGYGMLLHEGHPSCWAATRDPRPGIVVVSTHHPDRRVGDVAPFPADPPVEPAK